jgi:hypothetical protein
MEGKMRIALVVLAAAALVACSKKEEAATEPSHAAPAEEPADAGEAANDEEVAPPSGGPGATAYFAQLAGVWADPTLCGDYTQQWIIDASSINLHEMHCSVESVEETPNGVRTSGNCSVEGDDDGVVDTYELILGTDGALTIIQEANGARYTNLTKCGSTEL